MYRILASQMLEPVGFDLAGLNVDCLADSTCSYDGCNCSTTSSADCGTMTRMAITQ